MSHFTVLVPARSYEHLERILEPYNEQLEDDSPYIEYETDISPEEVSGVIEDAWKEIHDRKAFSWLKGNERTDRIAKRIDILKSENLSAIAHELGWRLGLDGSFGYYCNPNARWDWWIVGGRWSGLLKLKDGYANNGLEIGNGEPGVFGGLNKEQDQADYAPKYAIDWEAMRFERARDHVKMFNKVAAALDKLGYTPQDYMNNFGLRGTTEDEVEQGRKIHQSIRSAFHEMHGEPLPIFWEFVSADPNKSYEIKLMEPLTFGIIDLNGKWVTGEEMGWFGVSWEKNEGDIDHYHTAYWEIIDKALDDTIFFVVDCHI